MALLLEAALQTGRITKDTFDHLDRARRARNGWVHDQVHPSLENAEHALDGTAQMLKEVAGVTMKVPSGIQYGHLGFT